MFRRKASTFYSKKDIKSKTVLSFKREGKRVNIGLMELIYTTEDGSSKIPRDSLIPHLAKHCSDLENKSYQP
jgi:hypothetical protein